MKKQYLFINKVLMSGKSLRFLKQFINVLIKDLESSTLVPLYLKMNIKIK